MTSPEPIAIVGIGCRLPGGVVDPRSLWQLLRDGRDAISRHPDRSVRSRRALRRAAGHTWAHHEPVGRVRRRHRGASTPGSSASAPREAERLDPQQRLLLETAWEALEDAGVPHESIARTQSTGVFVGMWTNEYESRMFADRDRIDFHMTTGSGRYAASGRLSYFFGLLGPSVTIDTACSSSLVGRAPGRPSACERRVRPRARGRRQRHRRAVHHDCLLAVADDGARRPLQVRRCSGQRLRAQRRRGDRRCSSRCRQAHGRRRPDLRGHPRQRRHQRRTQQRLPRPARPGRAGRDAAPRLRRMPACRPAHGAVRRGARHGHRGRRSRRTRGARRSGREPAAMRPSELHASARSRPTSATPRARPVLPV